jgi:putative membrane protein
MSDQQENRMRRIIGWSIVGGIAAIAISIVVLMLLAPRIHYGYFPFHFGWLGGIFLIFIIFWVARWLLWPRRGYYSYPQPQRADAESIVRERYAKGEISKEQFEQMLRDLRQER